jgi:hypothetical protein
MTEMSIWLPDEKNPQQFITSSVAFEELDKHLFFPTFLFWQPSFKYLTYLGVSAQEASERY